MNVRILLHRGQTLRRTEMFLYVDNILKLLKDMKKILQASSKVGTSSILTALGMSVDEEIKRYFAG